MMTTRARTTTTRQLGLGFTLTEIVIVIVVIALLMSVAVPRLAGRNVRMLDHTADQVADMLGMFAQRNHLDRKTIGIDYIDGVLEMIVLVVDNTGARPRAEWEVDTLVNPVRLPEGIELEAYSDGTYMSDVNWPIIAAPDGERPSLEFRLSGFDLTRTIMLSPQATSPSIPERQGVRSARTPVDLDDLGRAREDW